MAFTGKSSEFLEQEIDNIDFFPNISVGWFQRNYRVPVSLAQDKVVEEITHAMNGVNDELKERVAYWQYREFSVLDNVDTYFTGLYLRAVAYRAKANLLSDIETFTRRQPAKQIDEDFEDVYRDLMSKSRRAVRRLLGKTPNVSVSII